MEILNKIQKELKAPKGQRNSFGNYNYRSCEDILEAVKPLLGTAILTLPDEIVMIGDRFYVKSTAILTDKGVSVSCTAFARESLEKKGMDTAQITGAASSYARKYALNGLFCIDDTKDADTADNNNEKQVEFITSEQITDISDRITTLKTFNLDRFLKYMGVTETSAILKTDFQKAINVLEQAAAEKLKAGKK